MKLSAKEWQNYITKLSQINKKAATLMQTYIDRYGFDNNDALIDYAYSLVSKYGEASGVLAAEMYDAIAVKSGVNVPPAEVAEPASYQYTAKAINGTMLNEYNTVSSTVGRLVKQVAADTTLKNALRDGAKFAWIPHGDTCAFCITLASRGWQYMSKNALKNGHAEHIHANCDCEYAISFDANPQVEGYDPQYYKDIYYGAEGDTPRERINAMRRDFYAKNKAAGVLNIDGSIAEEFIPNLTNIPAFTPAKTLAEAEEYAKQFAKNVTYKGISLEHANEINEALNELTTKYPIKTLGYIKHNGRQKAVARACFDELEINGAKIGKAYSDVFDNNQKYYRAMLKSLQDKYANRPIPTEIKKQIDKYEGLLRYSRFGISEKIKGTISHEYGHIIADQHYGMINGGWAVPKWTDPDIRLKCSEMKNKLVQVFREAKKNGDIYKLSQYAATDADEFFAEAFCAREMGETLPKYIADIVEEITNGPVV